MQPLAEILRPTKLTDFIGQEHLVGESGIITKLLALRSSSEVGFPSLILWGPSGVGKTTLARIIAKELNRKFYEFSAVNTSTKELLNVINPTSQVLRGAGPIIFLDEIHRFNKAQQDKLLPHVENGNIILIGATTENPSFEVISPLLSRCRVLILKQLDENNLKEIANKVIKHLKIKIDKKALEFLVESSNGDARILINTLEIAKSLSKRISLSVEEVEQAMQKRALSFDKNGDNFYDTISAFIKSMRSSDVDASLYYLARMISAGQDPLYIARRMVIFASEDIGMAQPTALVVANSVFKACEVIGYPECRINLAHGVTYLATAKKNRSSYDALSLAMNDVENYGNLPIPLNLRNPVTKLMQNSGYGKNYEMYSKISLLPDKIKNKKYYKKVE